MLSLTATELPRFMACNGFKSLGEVEPFNPSNDLTDEGNAAHWVAEQVHKGSAVMSLEQAPNGVFITSEMIDFITPYLDFVKTTGAEVEVETSHSGNGWEIRGRADCIRFENEELTVADLKYGWRIVEPVENWTLISHAIAWCQKNKKAPRKINFVIYQPRPYHPEGAIRKWSILYTDLLIYYESLRVTLEHPSDKVKCGAHCYKCKAMSMCPAAQIAAMNAIDVAETAFNSDITNDKLAWMLNNLKRAEEIIKQSYDAYQDLALHRLQDGAKVKGYSVTQALGNTTWNKDINSDVIKAMCGVDVTVSKLMTPAQAKKVGVPEDIIKDCTHRPNNGLKLVQIDENKLANKFFGDKK